MKATVSGFEQRRRFADKVAIAIIKAFSIVAIVILIIILSYIFIKGIVSNKMYESIVIPNRCSEQQPLTVLVNTHTRFDSMQYPVLQQLFDGRTFSLRKLTGVDRDVTLFIESGYEQAVIDYLQLQASSFSRSTPHILPRDELVQAVSDNPGAIGLIDASGQLGSTTHVATVALDDMVLAVHPSVTALVGNMKLTNIGEDSVEPLLAGDIASWDELQGQRLPVVVVEDITRVAETEGSVALVPYREAIDAPVEILPVMANKISKNFTWAYIFTPPVEMGKYGGISTIIGNTLLMVILTVLLATPLGVGAAVFMVEYKANEKVMSLIRSGVDLLAGVPSILFGLFGLLVFVQLAGWSFSLISGSMTLVIMVLPTIIRTSEEAMRSVSPGLREASVALGATKWETIWKVMLPAASPGIITGIILAIGRAVGETAALIYTIGSGTDFATGPLESARVLAMHIFLTITEGQSLDRAFSSAMVLVVLVLIINILARLSARRLFRHGAA